MSHTNILTLKIVLEVYKSCWICKLVRSSYKLVYSKNIYSYSENQHKTKQWILIYKLIWPANQLVFDHGDNSQKLAHNPYNDPPANTPIFWSQNPQIWDFILIVKQRLLGVMICFSLRYLSAMKSQWCLGKASVEPLQHQLRRLRRRRRSGHSRVGYRIGPPQAS